MPSWKKVILSGSNAALNSLNVSTSLTASGIIYPTTDGTSGQVVITDGNGNLSFSNIENTTISIKNVSGGTIAKGTPCYITGSGTSGNLAGVWPADASNPLRMPAGIIAGETLTAGAEGVGLLNGFINGVDTSAFAAGDSVYVAVGGGYTNVRPTGSSVLIQKLGNVEKSAINGSGVINGPGYYNEVPNIQQGFTWVGNSNGVAIAVATSSIQNVVSASFATSASFALSSSFAVSSSRAVSSSFASTASFVTTLNQNVLITGSATIGATSAGASENTLTLGARDTTNEGGQIGFNAPGGTYTSASFIDNWQNKARLLRGNNTTSDATVASWDLHTKQMQLPQYTNASSFVGTATANLAVDSGGNVITVSTSGGSVFPYTGNAVITGSLTTTGIIYAQPNGGMYFQGGDDAALYDINISNHMGIYGVQNSTVGAIKLGSSGPVLYGSGSNLGINTTNPSSASLTVNGNIWATSLTGSLLGTASFATQALSASFVTSASFATTSLTASYVNPLNQNVLITGSLSQGIAGNRATGIGSHAEGFYTKAIGTGSHAEGTGFIVYSDTIITNNVTYFECNDFSDSVVSISTSSLVVPGDYSGLTMPITLTYLYMGDGTNEFTINNAYYQPTPVISSATFDSTNTTFTFSTPLQSSYQYVEGNGIIVSLGDYSHVEGISTVASGNFSHAEGNLTITIGQSSHAEGYQTVTSGSYSHAEGLQTTATGDASHAEGVSTIAKGFSSHTEGVNTITEGGYSHAEGANTITSGSYSHAEGFTTTATGDASHTEGVSTVAIGQYSHAEGQNTRTIGQGSHTEGRYTTASGQWSHAEGLSTISFGIHSHAEGNGTLASGSYSHAEGAATIASGSYSHAEGNRTIAMAAFSHAEGRYTTSSGQWSHAEGDTTRAIGNYSHAEGATTIASGAYSHAEGLNTISLGSYSHAEGISTISSGAYSHAEGNLTTALGAYSHVEGVGTRTIGDASHAEGYFTTASGNYQHVQGTFNVASSNAYAFIVGNGVSNASRSNLVFASGSTFQVTGSVIATQGFTGSLFGTASVAATSVITTQDVTPVTYNVTFTGGTSGNHSLNVDATTLTYNPSTTTLTVTNLAGTASFAVSSSRAVSSSFATQALSASFASTTLSSSFATQALSASFAVSASRAISSSFATLTTTATNAVNVGVTDNTSTNATYYIPFVDATSGNRALNVDSANLTFNPSTNTLVVNNLTGNASTSTTAAAASQVAVTDTTTGTGPYYVMFADGTTGNRTARVDSAALTFNATTNILTTTASFAQTASFVASTSNAFIQNGNSFGTTALLGTNDNQPLALETNGTTRMFISSSGNVGIGTTTPTQLGTNITTLDIKGSSGGGIRSGVSGGSESTFYTIAAGSYLGTISNIPLNFQTNNSVKATILANGNVGIGTTTPAQKLDVYGVAVFGTDTNRYTTIGGSSGTMYTQGETGGWAFGHHAKGSSGTDRGGFGWLGSSDAISYYYIGSAYNTATMYITSGSTGLVGIGTSTPATKLDIVSTTNDSFDSIIVRPTNLTQTLSIGWQGISASLNYIVNAGASERMRITSTGNTGLNTSAPETKLQIEDVTKVLTNNVAGVAQGTLSLVSTDAQAANVGASLLFGGNYINSNSTRIAYAAITGRKSNSTSSNADGYLSFLTWRTSGLTEAMRITAAGDVGVGTATPLLTSSGRGNVTINGSTDSILSLGINGVYSGYLYSDSTRVELSSNTQPIALVTNGNERMRITSAGNVGIGTTSPESSVPLSVNTDNNSFNSTLILSNSNTGTSALAQLQIRTANQTSTPFVIHQFNNGAAVALTNVANANITIGTNNTTRLTITNGGAMGLGVTPTNTLGRFEASNDIVAYSTSDKRWKNNIVKIDSPLEKISQISGVEFDWIEDEPLHGNKGHDVGVIAQEIELVIPEAVQTRESGMKAVQYDKIIPLLIESIKEQQKQIEELKQIVNGLTN